MTSTDVDLRLPVYAVEVTEVAAAVDSDLQTGLTEAEASRRLERDGPNEIATEEGPGTLRLLFRQFADLLTWILIGAAVISGLLLGDLLEATVIMAIVILNTVIGFTQEMGAETALAELKELAAPRAAVRRSGRPRQIPADEVVLGDVLELAAGDQVAADARVVESFRLTVDESALTGESLPVPKTVVPVDAGTGVADRRDMVHAGTVVAGGRGTAVVTAVGQKTEMGAIAELLGEEEPDTPLQLELARTGRRIAAFAGLAAVGVFTVGTLNGWELESMFLTAVALAVAAIPEGLPAVTTITLARGVREMAAEHAIVRRLTAVEALGAAEVICTDKTGTLTRNEMRVHEVAFASGRRRSREALATDRVDSEVGWYGTVNALCNDVRETDRGLIGDATEIALFESVDGPIVDASAIRNRHPRIDELAFDSDRKRMTTVHRWGEEVLIATKGAPERILERCTHRLAADGPRPLHRDEAAELLAQATEMAGRGLRTLAVAYRLVGALDGDPERDLVFVAIAGMSDELREEVPPAVDAARRAGIEVVMVTGDHAVTACSIGDELRMIDGRSVVSGSDLSSMSPAELERDIDTIGVFARVEPADKVAIVDAWQARGRIVAMTGDGVNDAPALRRADIGVSMGSGTEVSKQASDVVLADDNFATIVRAVERGRAIFSNLRQVVYFLLAANISEIFVMLIGSVVFASFGEPLLAVQLLWVNLVTDGLPALALGIDPPAPGLMDGPIRSDRNMLARAHQIRLLWQGAVLAAGPLLVFAWSAHIRQDPWEVARTLGFTTLVIVQLFHALTVRAQHRSVFRTPIRNRWLVGALVGSAAIHAIAVQTELGQHLLRSEATDLAAWWTVLIGAIGPFLVIDATKVWIRGHRGDGSASSD
jgi:Ca2+-transporting ATPase